MQEIGAKVVAFRDIDYARGMVSVCFHQRFEIGVRDKGKLSPGGFAFVRLKLALVLSFGRR